MVYINDALNNKDSLSLGDINVTRNVHHAMEVSHANKLALFQLINRHQLKDWGNVCDEDKQANNEALQHDEGGRILSSYTFDGSDVWIITEWSGSFRVTTILFPYEY